MSTLVAKLSGAVYLLAIDISEGRMKSGVEEECQDLVQVTVVVNGLAENVLFRESDRNSEKVSCWTYFKIPLAVRENIRGEHTSLSELSLQPLEVSSVNSQSNSFKVVNSWYCEEQQ